MTKKYQTYHIDDCDWMRELILCSFQGENYEINSINPIISNFKKPSNLISKHPKILFSDLVITDYEMKVFNGLELCMELRSNNYKNPIYCLSGKIFNSEEIKQFSDLEVEIYDKTNFMLLKENIVQKLN